MSFFSKAFKKVSKDVSSVAKGARGVLHSPVTKMALGGVALAFPVVGVPALAAAETLDRTLPQVEAANATVRAAVDVANKTLSAVESKNPALRTGAVKAIARTAILARRGDADAMRALKVLQQVKRGRQLAKANARPRTVAPVRGARQAGLLVANGQIQRGTWVRVG